MVPYRTQAGCSNANPGLRFNFVFQFVNFGASVYFQIPKQKALTDPAKIFERAF